MALKEHLGLPREWLQTMLTTNNRECVRCDAAKKRSGAYSLEQTHANWKKLTSDSQIKLTANEQMKIKVSTGSSFWKPVSPISDEKANNWFMHIFQGHLTKMVEEVTQDIREFSDTSKWPKRIRTCKEDLDEARSEVELDLPLDELGEVGTLKKKLSVMNTNITMSRKKLKVLKDSTDDLDQDTHEIIEKVKGLEEVAEELRAEQRNLAKNGSAGLAYKACRGLEYLIAKVNKVLVNGSKVPRSKMEYLWITFLEIRGKGKFDIKRAGTNEQWKWHELSHEFQVSNVHDVGNVRKGQQGTCLVSRQNSRME